MGEKINADTTFDTKPYTKLKEKKLENIDYSVLSGKEGMTAEKVKAIAEARIKAEFEQSQKDIEEAAKLIGTSAPSITPAAPSITPAAPSITPAAPSIAPAAPSAAPAAPSAAPSIAPSIAPAAPSIALKITELPLSANIRTLFKLPANTEIPEKLKGITQETIDALKNRKIEITSIDVHAIYYNIPYKYKSENGTTDRIIQNFIGLKFQPNLDINKELMNLSKIPETRLDNYVNLEGKGILSLQSDLVYLNNDTYPIGKNRTIGENNYIAISNNLTIHDYRIEGSNIVLSIYDNDTLTRSTRILVVGTDGSISENGVVIARKRTQQEQNTINKNDAERIAKDSADKEKLKKYMIATLEEYRVEANRKLPVNLQITRINFSNGGSYRGGTSATSDAFNGNKTDITLVYGNRKLYFGSIEIRGHLQGFNSTDYVANKTKNMGDMVDAMKNLGEKSISDAAYNELTKLGIQLRKGEGKEINLFSENTLVGIIDNKKPQNINTIRLPEDTKSFDFKNGEFILTGSDYEQKMKIQSQQN